jgi:CubicO group peptidase (beta-lactamase class C family)
MRFWYHIHIILVFICFSNNIIAQQEHLEEQIASILKKHKVPGAAIAVVKKDSLLWNGYFGKTQLDGKNPVTKNTLFGLGSLSKTFLALGCMIAEENYQLDINTHLKETIPALPFTNEFETSSSLKLIHLLEHTSGFDEAHFDIFARTNSQTPFNAVIDKSQSALTTRWKPGQYYSYNTLNYILAAAVLENKVNTSFEEYMKRKVFMPLEMDKATYFPTNESGLVTAYSGKNKEEFPNIPQWPAGSLSTTLEEMQRFTQLFLNQGIYNNNHLVSPETIKKMESPESSLLAKQGVSFGYGKGLMQEFVGQNVFYGHNGSYGGFLSEFGYSREVGIGYIVLINNRDASKAVKEIKNLLLETYMTENKDEINRQATNQIFSNELSEIEGAYKPVTSNLQILYPFISLADLQFIEKENDKWVQKSILGDAQELVREEEYTFKLKNEPKASSTFLISDDEVLWLGETSYRKISKASAYAQFYFALFCTISLIVTFFTLGISLLRKLIFKKSIHKALLTPFLAILFLLIGFSGLAFLYDPKKLYSSGAIIYYICSWLFLIFSIWAFYHFIGILLKKTAIRNWMGIQIGISSIACLAIASYLLYWGLIGLKLWNY